MHSLMLRKLSAMALLRKKPELSLSSKCPDIVSRTHSLDIPKSLSAGTTCQLLPPGEVLDLNKCWVCVEMWLTKPPCDFRA